MDNEKPRAKQLDEGNILVSQSDKLIHKYISVWLWSIILGISATLAFSFINYRFSNWGNLSIAPLLAFMFGLLFVLNIFIGLWKYLYKYLLPKFISTKNSESAESDETATRYLGEAFKSLILGILLRVVLNIIDLLFTITGSGTNTGF